MGLLLTEHLNDYLSNDLREIEKHIKERFGVEIVVDFDEDDYGEHIMLVLTVNNDNLDKCYIKLTGDFKLTWFADNMMGQVVDTLEEYGVIKYEQEE